MHIKNGNTNEDSTKCSLKDFIDLIDKYSIDQAVYHDLCQKKFENL